jgi:hypothetical protein
MAKLYDEEGNEINDVLTKEEADQMKTELEAKAKLADADREELEKLRKKDLNFAKLREQLKDKKPETPPKEEKKEEPPKEEERKPEPQEELSKELTSMLDELGDTLEEDEQKEAMALFSQLSKGITDPKLRKIFAEKAIALSKTDTDKGGDNFRRSNNAPVPGKGPNKGKESDTSKQIGSTVFGLNDDQKKKYSDPNWKPEWTHVKRPK